MIKKIKEKRIIPGILFALALLILPLAFVDGLAATIAAYTASAITGIFLLTIATISLVFSAFTDWFLRITLSPEFISVPYTPGGADGGNEFVFYGWRIIRDFVNMFFIFVLLIIGLSTALQVETYKWQKTLPRLVAVALLINFTPTILGVFIDFSNMMMNHFVTPIPSESVFVIRMRALYDIMASSLADTPWTSFTGAIITPVAMMIIFTLFNTFTGLIYGLYGTIFAMRYVAIWLLVIISPFGFFCYILPATQPFFRTWWRWFIGWCIIGIAGAFFLYLGEIMFQFIDNEAMMPTVTEHHGMEIGLFVQVFPLLIPLFFIFFGFFVSLSMAALGSKGLIETFQKASGAARKTSAQLPGSSFREKTMAASSAVKSAFSPGPAVSSLSSSDSLDSPSFRKSTRGSSLHRRKDEGIKTGSALGGRNPLSEITSHAEGGAESATKDIAAEFGEKAKEPSGSLKIGSSDAPSSSEEKKCSGCGAPVSDNSSTCALCKKNALPPKEPMPKGPSSKE
jgi:hypothetical protein